MRRVPVFFLLIAAVTLLPRASAAQPPAGAQPPGGRGQGAQPARNLQVLPKDMPRPALVARMREFTFALGVRCEHCHVQVAGQPQPVFDVDDKIEKQKAREMIKMVDTINNTMLAALPGRTAASPKVDCVTCHRGLPVPSTLRTTLTETLDKNGIDAAVKQYRDLREKDLTSGRYDFGESSLTELARAQNEKGNVDAAIRLAELNAEFFPKSENLNVQLGELYLAKGDKDKALARFKMALEANPNNNRAKTRVAELEKK
jgi:hypothetical protein